MSNQPYIKTLRVLSILSIVLAAGFLSGCDNALLNPKGQVGLDVSNLIIASTLLMLIVVIPVIIMTIWFAWRYRASNAKATYLPNWEHSTKIEIVLWTVPCLIILALSILTWESTQDLDPGKPLVSNEKPLVINVVALDWKWLFIYPEQGIATVNEIAVPVNVPIQFHITSGTVMNSFFIPQLGSQIYAMAGMENKLNLIANHTGIFPGMSANYSGEGFSDMKFNTISGTRDEFDAWVNKVKSAPRILDIVAYETLTKPTIKHPVEYFAAFKPNLFHDIMISSRDAIALSQVNNESKTDHANHSMHMPADKTSDMHKSTTH